MVVAKKDELLSHIENNIARLNIAMEGILDLLYSQLSNLTDAYALRQPLNVLLQHQQRLDELIKNMSLAVVHCIKLCQQEFNNSLGRLNALSPLAILSRGYSITKRLSDGYIVKDVSKLTISPNIIKKLNKGEIKSKVM